jgi:hypothetical protein
MATSRKPAAPAAEAIDRFCGHRIALRCPRSPVINALTYLDDLIDLPAARSHRGDQPARPAKRLHTCGGGHPHVVPRGTLLPWPAVGIGARS